MEFMELINIPSAEDIALLHFQNTIVDYEIRMVPTSKQNASFRVISMKNMMFILIRFFQSHSNSLDKFYGLSFSSHVWSKAGFVLQLERKWTRYIFIYYIPSALCVITSWASFLISPQVSTYTL